MNGRVAKKHRRAADKVALAWLKTLVSEEEAKVYTIKNFKGYLTKTTHIMRSEERRVGKECRSRWVANH
mgnify:CR=1 FL=1